MSAECHDDVCITCSDQLLAMVVTHVDAEAATARGTIDGSTIDVGIELLDSVAIGDVLLCHGGVALQRSSTAEVSA